MNRLVFDAEPLIAYFWNEKGSNKVDKKLQKVENNGVEGYISYVSCTEIHYIIRREEDKKTADKYLRSIKGVFKRVGIADIWEKASYFKTQYNISLGDVFTLGTAVELGATAYVGADDDFDNIKEVEIERFRKKSE